ncbi:MAG: Uma2 family endonuclease [Candidatus Kuenenia sp.]|nr:Uma2 family endonuclease [Candidatus Kuenenia hertensis]
MVTAKDIFFYDDLDKLPAGLYEIIDGRIIEMTPSGIIHGFSENKVGKILDENLSQKGYVLTGEVGILISKEPLKIRGADIAFVTKDRLKTIDKGILKISPDLIVEILSPSDVYLAVDAKIKDYIDIGVNRIVIINPEEKIISTISEDRSLRFYTFDDEVEFYKDVKIKLAEVMK